MNSRTGARTRLNLWELAIAATLFLLGAYMLWQGVGYSVGNLRQMGAGFFPVVVGATLMLLSLGIMLETRHSAEAPPDLPLRPLAGITAGLVTFAVTVEPLGLIPATFLLVLLSMGGDRGTSWKKALITALILAAFGYLLFGLVFRLSIHAFWW